MSEFLAEAQVLIAPNTAGFAVSLKKQLEAAVAAAGPVVVPITAAPLAAGVGAATADLSKAQLGLAGTTDVLNSAFGQEAVLLDAVTISEKAAADAAQVAGAAFTLTAKQLNALFTSTVALSQAQELNAASLAKLAGIQEAVSLTTSKLAASRVVLRNVTAAAALSQEALAAAIKTGSVSIVAAQAGITNLVVATRELAVANVQAAIAETESGAAAARSAAGHAQATRGIVAETLALGGLRGATLAASAPFLVGATAAIVFAKSIKEASSETEELNKASVVFGASANRVKEFSKTTARSLGISRTEALRAAGVFGNLFRTIKIGEQVSASMSIRLVKLASDLASFNNSDPSRTLEALRSGLVGQARPLRVFGIFLSAARVQQEALNETNKKSAKSLTDAEKVQARYNIILADSAISSNDFANTSDRLANQTRIFKAEISNLGAELGTVLLPVVTGTVTAFNDLFSDIQGGIDTTRKLATEVGGLASEIQAASPAQFVIEIIQKVPGGGEIGDAFKKLKAELEIAAGAAAFTTGATFSELGVGIPVAAAGIILLNKGLHDFNAEAKQAGTNAKKSVQDLFDQFKRAGQGSDAFKALISGLTALEAKLSTGDAFSQAFARGILRLIIQLRGLGNNPKIEDIGKAIADAIARGFSTRAFVIGDAVKKAITFNQSQITGQLQAQVTAVAKAQAFGGTGLGELQAELARIDKILASKKAPVGPVLESLLNERKSVIGQIKSINEDKSNAVIAAATKAAEAQNKAIQNFVDTFSGKHQKLENRLSTAGLFGTAKQQIAINKLIILADAAEIKAIKALIAHLHLQGDALKAAQAEIKKLNQEIFNTQNAIAKLQSDRKQAIVDARQSHLEAQLSIAETTTSTKDDATAIKALIAFDNVQIARIKALKKAGKATRDEIAQLDAYRVDLAQRKKALRDLQKQNEDTSKAAQSFAFSFLQTQQGFAANLLGNLIPGFATSGLVGGGNGATTAAGDPLRQVAGGFEQPRGSVEGMAAVAGSRDRGVRPVQVDTTNQLLRRILAALQGRPGHPEAQHQRRTATASYYGPDHGF